jgi:diamine N-acetyltransferase
MNEIKLRKFSLKDIQAVFETINNSEITKYFRFYGTNYQVGDIENFIINSFGEKNQNFAIIDNSDNYLGTISLKNIDIKSKNAEYAIMLGEKSIGKGIAFDATNLVLYYAFYKLNLNKVYLNVITENKRAVNFYIKFGFRLEGLFKQHVLINQLLYDLNWFSIFKNDFISNSKYCFDGINDRIPLI